MTPMTKDDRIYPLTRAISVLIVPFLLLAFVILYLYPDETGRRFAWEIQPHMTALFMGAGYLGGAYLFVNAIFGRRWHRVAAGFLPVTAFTVTILAATLLYWDRFDLGHFPFQLWLGLYTTTPLLVPWLWLRNRPADPSTPEADDVTVPTAARWSLGLLGGILALFTLGSFIRPDWAITIWPWQLDLMTARMMGCWFALLGAGGIVISQDGRWSAWRIGLESIALWHVLVLLGAALNRQDFAGSGLINWYTVSVALVLAGMVVLFGLMESRRRRNR